MKIRLLITLFAALAQEVFAFYAPDEGRWVSRDPVEEQGGVNLHAFVDNSPINDNDKLGLIKINVDDDNFASENKTWSKYFEENATSQAFTIHKVNFEPIEGSLKCPSDCFYSRKYEVVIHATIVYRTPGTQDAIRHNQPEENQTHRKHEHMHIAVYKNVWSNFETYYNNNLALTCFPNECNDKFLKYRDALEVYTNNLSKINDAEIDCKYNVGEKYCKYLENLKSRQPEQQRRVDALLQAFNQCIGGKK